MKKLVRYMLIGVCFLFGSFPLRAENNLDGGTEEICVSYKYSRIQLHSYIKNEVFAKFRERDSVSILDKNTDTLKYKISYQIGDFIYFGDSVSDIGTVRLTGYKDQYLFCKVPYTRTIQFDFREPFFRNGDECFDSISHWQRELFGLKENDYPRAEIKSDRVWQYVIRIRKTLPSDETFAIEGDVCLYDDKITLKVPEQYADMQCSWYCDNTYISMSNEVAPEITISRKDKPFLTTNVQCAIQGCDDKGSPMYSSIEIRSGKTPASTLSFSDCVPVSSKLSKPTLRVTASNNVPGVQFQWDRPVTPIFSSSTTSQTVDYPVQGSDNFTITLTTLGGCETSTESRVVHRKLTSSETLQVSDSCLTSGTLFTVATVPPLPNMDLEWDISPRYDFRVYFSPTGKQRKDQITLNKIVVSDSLSTITVKDRVCNSSLSKTIKITEPYTEMTARDNNNNTINNGDTAPQGIEEITFIAPQHRSITGEKPYDWEVWILRGEGGPSKMISGKGSVEWTISAPVGASRISVKVSYTSCRGRESKTYEIYTR